MIGIASISDVIKNDHREIEDEYDKMIQSDDATDKARHQASLVWTLARQCVAEELIVLPALEAYVEDGEIIAQKDRQEHEKVSPAR